MNGNDIAYALKKFIKDRGIYLALCVCLVAVMTLAVTTAGGDTPITDESGVSAPQNNDSSDVGVGKTESGITDSQSESETPSVPASMPEMPPASEADPSSQDESNPQNESGASIIDNGSESSENTETTVLLAPVRGEISRGYSREALVFSETTGDWRSHLAVDYEGERGDKVVSAADGTVADVYEDELYGKTVTVVHEDGSIARYCGLRNITVAVDDRLSAEDVIGELSGEIPIEQKDGTHLHFELIVNGEQKDPAERMN